MVTWSILLRQDASADVAPSACDQSAPTEARPFGPSGPPPSGLGMVTSFPTALPREFGPPDPSPSGFGMVTSSRMSRKDVGAEFELNWSHAALTEVSEFGPPGPPSKGFGMSSS